jgi:phage shock protein A
MNIFQRISKLVTANINHLLDEAEDPEVMVKQLIREMEESIIELRRETVKAIARQKQLEKQIQMAKDRSNELESKAVLALEKNDEEFARQILGNKMETEESMSTMQEELKIASRMAEQMKSDLTKLEDQVQLARRKKEELIRRKRSADAHLRTRQVMQKSNDALNVLSGTISDINQHTSAIESYKDKILQLEAEAEASEELLKLEQNKELELDKFVKEKAIEDELAKLKKKIQGK